MTTVESLANFERSVAAINYQMFCLGPLIRKFLPLRLNIDRCSGPWREPIVLNLRIAEWPKQYKYCQEVFGNRILAMDIRWLEAKA